MDNKEHDKYLACVIIKEQDTYNKIKIELGCGKMGLAGMY